MVEQVNTADAPPAPPPPDPPSQQGPEANKELRAAYKSQETPGIQPTKEFQADLNEHQSDQLSREAQTLPNEYYGEVTAKETPESESASRSLGDVSWAPGTPPTQAEPESEPEDTAPHDMAKPKSAQNKAQSPTESDTPAAGEDPERWPPTEVPRIETAPVPSTTGPGISPQMAAALYDQGSAPSDQVAASSDQVFASPERGSPSTSALEASSGPATNEQTIAVITRTHDAPPTADVCNTPPTAGQTDEVKPEAPDIHATPPSPTDTPVQPQTKDIVLVGGDPLMRSELIDYLGSHGFGKDNSVQFDADRLHQSHDMDPTTMVERMKAGDLTVIDLGASPTQDTLENISANSDRQALGVPQLNEHGTPVPGSGSFARQDSPEDANPSYLPVYETMGNTDSAVVTGQSMDRVRQYADETGAGTYEPPQTRDTHAQYAMNMAWMGAVMVNNPREAGDTTTSAVTDVGANPFGTTGPSYFVAAENRVTSNLGVLRDEIPPEVNGA